MLAPSPMRPNWCPMRDWARSRSGANSPTPTRKPPRSCTERASASAGGSTTIPQTLAGRWRRTLICLRDLATHMRIPLFARNGLPVMPNVWDLYEMLVQAKTIDPHPDPAKLFNDTIVEPTKRFTLPAVEELGLPARPRDRSDAQGRLSVPAEAGGELLRRLGTSFAEERRLRSAMSGRAGEGHSPI